MRFTMLFAALSPMPLPPKRFVKLWSSWVRGWKIFDRNSSSMPMPVSAMTKRTQV